MWIRGDNVLTWIRILHSVLQLLLLYSGIVNWETEYCYEADPNPNRLYGTKTPYNTNRQFNVAVDDPPGCYPAQLWLLARHGTRFHKYRQMEEMQHTLESVWARVFSNPQRPADQQGAMCEGDREALRHWRFRMTEDDQYKLAGTGWDELIEMAHRFKSRLPTLLDRRYQSNLFEFRHTNYSGNGDRTRDTARAFVQGLFGRYEDIELIEGTEPDWLLHFYKYCRRYTELVGDHEPPEVLKYDQSSYMHATKRETEERLGLTRGSLTLRELWMMYDNCRVEFGVYSDAPWCSAFTSSGIDVFEYRDDLRYYWMDAYGHDVTYRQACTLVRDVLQHLRDAAAGEGKVVVSRFAHSGAIDMLLSRLSMFRDDHDLLASHYEHRQARRWQTSRNNCFGANIAFILYTCPSSSGGGGDPGTFTVKVMVNEEPVVIPGCDDVFCCFETFTRALQPLADDCDLDTICRWP